MCGIAGAIGFITEELQRAVAAAGVAQRHRGPDDEGDWSSTSQPGPGAVFSFRRLAIIDLTPAGHQPMVDATTGNAIVFNGEIYNHEELRAELRAGGWAFASRSDTEVVLAAFARWGEAAVSRLRGMFAIALWDAVHRRVLLARDRVGIKPLYYVRVSAPDGRPVVLFASELRSLLATGLVERRLDRAAVGTYLWNGFVVGPSSIVAGVHLLPAGAMAIVDPDSPEVSPKRFWALPQSRPAAASRAAAELPEVLGTAMRQHLVSDVPLGVFLSGGIDSSALAALAAAQAPGGPESVCTFNVSFDESGFDESPYAKAVAAALGTRHTDVRLSQDTFASKLGDALAAIDQPTFDGINTWFVSRAVRDAGITVALAGTGGDELFGGYRSFAEVPRIARYARAVRGIPSGMLRGFAALIMRWKSGRSGAIPPQTRWGKLGDLLSSGGELLDCYQIAYALFTEDIYRGMQVQPPQGLRRGMPQASFDELAALAQGASDHHAIATFELANFLGERLLRDTDWAGMGVSLEIRVPLLDHHVIECVANLDSAYRFDPLGRKQVLRDLALGGLPPELFDRPKSGFVLPIEAWCKQQLRSEVAETLTDRGTCEAVGLRHEIVGRLWAAFSADAPGMYWSRVWAVFVLMRWCRDHSVRL